MVLQPYSVAVLSTGGRLHPRFGELPKIGTFAKPPVQLDGQEKEEQAKPTAAPTPIEPIAPVEEQTDSAKDDFDFDSILKIFEHRD